MPIDLATSPKHLHLPITRFEVPKHWAWSRLNDVCQGVFDCPHSTPKLTTTGPLLARTQDIITGIFRTETAAHVSEETYLERTIRVSPDQGDILYSREGTYFGIAAVVPEATRVCLGQRMVLIRPDGARVDYQYLCYWLNSPLMNAFVSGYKDGSVAERLNLPTIRALPVLLPPLAEQKSIGHFLATLDDKIELNRRMNATIEEMARSLFKSWFIDFDPVRAKSNGYISKIPGYFTSKYFPDSFENSHLGSIPCGWKIYPLADKIILLSGGTPKTSEPGYWNGDIPWYSVKDAPNEGDVWVIKTEKYVSQLGIDNSATQVLPENTTIISARGTVGKLALTGIPMAMNQSCYGVRGSDDYGSFFTHFMLRNATLQLQQRVHGSVFDTITRQTFQTLDCIFPPQELTLEFDRIVEPLLLRIRANILESSTLIDMRNLLLPQLLSGELRVLKPETPYLSGA